MSRSSGRLTRRSILIASAIASGGGALQAYAPLEASASSGRPSGLPWDSGVFARQNGDVAAGFAAMRGAPLDVVSVYADVSSKEAAAKSWWLASVPRDYSGTISLGVPLWTVDSSIEDAESGGMDDVYRSVARALVSQGYGDAYIRLAWEMNIFCDSRSGALTPQNSRAWVAAFRRAVGVFRSVAPGLQIVFNPNIGPSQTGIEADAAYPGNDVVDVIGVDAYDWWPSYVSDANWEEHFSQSRGWKWWMDFSRGNGKRFAVPEWGVAPANSHSGGDNPKYIGYVFNYLRDNSDNVAFECYFEETADYCRSALAMNPSARGAYQWWIAKLR